MRSMIVSESSGYKTLRVWGAAAIGCCSHTRRVWQIQVACRIGQDKQLHGAEFPGLSVAQQHRAYALYASLTTLGRAAIQGEPGTG